MPHIVTSMMVVKEISSHGAKLQISISLIYDKVFLTLVWALTMTSAYAQTSDIMKKYINPTPTFFGGMCQP